MTGIILCGGKSTRMGTDKGMLKPDEKTWAQTAIDKMASLNIPLKISVNKDQLSDYTKEFPATDLISDNEALHVNGPLLGVLSCHLQHPSEDLFILACDMPLIEPSLLTELYNQYYSGPPADAYLYMNNKEPEPLCGIYSARGLSRILTMLRNGLLAKHSMKFMLEQLGIKSIELAEDQKKYFRNFNAHAELNGL